MSGDSRVENAWTRVDLLHFGRPGSHVIFRWSCSLWRDVSTERHRAHALRAKVVLPSTKYWAAVPLASRRLPR